MNVRAIDLGPDLAAYIAGNQPPEHRTLRALRERTRAHSNARMLVSRDLGAFLALLVKLTQARRVLELGTFTGYSALAMALALPEDGHLTTCDVDRDTTSTARQFWEHAQVDHKIELRIGTAIETLEKLIASGAGDGFDLVFIDANKNDYDRYYEMSLRLVRPGGVIVFDNMLQNGRVADPSDETSHTVAIRGLNTKIAADERVDRVLLAFGDGVVLARRRA